jgi:hypothetical protein
MTTTTDPYPDVPPPAGTTTTLDDWKEWGYKFRFVWGDGRRVEATNIRLTPCAAQLPDGSIDAEGVVAEEPPSVFIDQVENDGTCRECLKVSVEGARNLAAALLDLVDAVDGWAAK